MTEQKINSTSTEEPMALITLLFYRTLNLADQQQADSQNFQTNNKDSRQ